MGESVHDADNWRMQPDWVQVLSSRVGNALVSVDDNEVMAQLAEVDGLIESGYTPLAALVTQAALYRVVRGRVTRKDVDVSQITDASNLELLLQEATTLDVRALELAPILEAAGRVLVEQSHYRRASEIFSWAATIRSHQGNVVQEAGNLLRAGAAAFKDDNNQSATAFSQRALDAYTQLDDHEGAAFATLNLVQIANDSGDVELANALLNEARGHARELRNAHIDTSIVLEEGFRWLQTGDLARARSSFRKAHASAYRRRDYAQALVAAKNLALAAGDASEPTREVHWWRKAIEHARAQHDWDEEQDLEHALGLVFMRSGEHEAAYAAFDRAIAVSEAHDMPGEASRAKADKAAAVLDHAMQQGLEDQEFLALTASATRALEEAREELESLKDYDWAAVTVRNLRTAWILQNAEEEGAARLIEVADQPDLPPSYLVELRRNAAWLLLTAGAASETDERAVQWLIDAAADSHTDALEKAWSLAKQAATLTQRGFDAAALRLYDDALERISNTEDRSAYGNILNDSVVVMDSEADIDEIERRLLQVEQIARSANDRVLLSLALVNLAETSIRQGQVDSARGYLHGAIQLAQQIGDHARAATALASLSNTYVEEGDTTNASTMSADALRTAVLSGSNEAWVLATSATASAAYLGGDYETAYQRWIECIARETPERSGEHQAFALDALAQLGSWPRFKRELDRLAKLSQKTNTQFVFVEKLYLSALTWLRAGRPAAAGKVIAIGVLLAFEAASHTYGPQGRELSTADRQRSLVKIASATGAARAVFELLELPNDQAKAVRRAYERTIRKVAGEFADQIIEIVDKQISDADLDDE